MLIPVNRPLLRYIILSQNSQINVGRYANRTLSSSSSPSPSSVSNAQQSKSNEQPISDNSDWFNVESGTDINERVVPKPISYLPDHLPQLRKRQKQKPWWKFRYFVDVNTLPNEQQEYTEQPEYPPIFEPTTEGKRKQIRLDWYNAIRRLPTAEQKIYEITKHYGHLSLMIDPVMATYNALPAQQFITRTHLINGLPESYRSTNNDRKNIEHLRQQILAIIAGRLFEAKSRIVSFDFRKTLLSTIGRSSRANVIQSLAEDDIVADVIQLLIQNNNSTERLDHHLDFTPFVSTSWWLGDYPIPFRKSHWFRDNERINQLITYRGNHSVHWRTMNPLPSIVSFDDPLSCTKIPECNYNLLKLGVTLRRHNIMSLPGFWPDRSGGHDFPYLLAMNYESLRQRKQRYGLSQCMDDQDVLDGMAIISAFSWLTGLANNLGFTLYDRLTYPLVTNVIITDGQHWSFYVYQLNNHCFHDDLVADNENDDNRLCNLCWSSGQMRLFDSYENGKLQNVNTAVLDLLIDMLNMKTVDNHLSPLELRPYLSIDSRQQQRERDELTYSLRRKFANQIDTFVARRKKTNLWETVYKNHKEAFIDVKRIRPKIEMKYPPFFK
ncbi:Structural constituent of ribosome [Dermatophagoides farinae]|uniref:Structural constituent of ribosome n=1 Tax=Dermatophagoides farinae TaxID=6954 RepID=A0A922HTH0_DERFA|nr:Structural constituent of ribosome [Dermatophagoides farinae]